MHNRFKSFLKKVYFFPGGIINRCLFLLHGASVGHSLEGVGCVYIRNRGTITIGNGVRIRSGFYSNPIGVGRRTVIRVFKNGSLHIGDGVKMSNVSICCQDCVNIGNYAMLGGGVKIYDTDFHSLNPSIRMQIKPIPEIPKTKSVTLGSFVFIGAGSYILKGVTIGDNSVVGAGSVVRDNIPSNEVWAGNPAVKIRDLREDELYGTGD